GRTVRRRGGTDQGAQERRPTVVGELTVRVEDGDRQRHIRRRGRQRRPDAVAYSFARELGTEEPERGRGQSFQMQIGELSDRTDVSPRLLRYYEQQGPLNVTRRSNGYRDYSDEAVDTVRRIRLLLDAGLNTESIRMLLPCIHGDDPSLELCTEVD